MTTNAASDAVTPRRVGRVLWRRLVVCVLVAAVVLVGGSAWLVTRQPLYQSTSEIALLPQASNAAVLPNYPNLIASLIPTYVQLVSSPVLLDKVVVTVPFPVTEAELATEIHAESLSNAAVIDIVASSPNAVRAQELASATTTAFLTQLQGNGVVIPKIYGRPTLPTKPASPNVKLVLAALVVLAVALGLAAGLTWDRLLARPAAAGQLAPPHEQPTRTAEEQTAS